MASKKFEQSVSPEKEEQKKKEKIRSFFVENLPIKNEIELASKSLGELLKIYQHFLEVEAAPDGFKIWSAQHDPALEEKLKQKPAEEWVQDKDLSDLWRKFLHGKLPRAKIEREEKAIADKIAAEEKINPSKIFYQKDFDIPLITLEQMHQKSKSRLFLGLHVDNRDYQNRGEIPPSFTESNTDMAGQRITIPAGYAHYSVGTNKVYKKPFQSGQKVFLYLVEGSEADLQVSSSNLQSYRQIHRHRGWVATARPLPIIQQIELTPAIEKELGLERV